MAKTNCQLQPFPILKAMNKTIKLSTNCETNVEPVALNHTFFSPVIFLIL